LAGGLAALAAVLLLAGGIASAGDEAGARVLFVEARKLAAAGDYEAACPKFEDSYRLDPGIGTNFNLADCYEHRGRIASAWARFLDVAAATKAAGQPERERVARARAAALEPRLARLTLEVQSTAPDLSIVRDGIAVGAASWRVAVPIDPGSHAIEASAPGRLTWKSTVEVPDAGAISVVVPELEPAPAEPSVVVSLTAPGAAATAPGPAPVVDAVATREAPASRLSRPVILLGSIAVVAIATGAAFGLMYESHNDDARKLCPSNIFCSQQELDEHASLLDSARTDLRFEAISFAVGGATALAAGYLWWRAGRHDGGTGARASISAAPLGTAGAAFGGSW
jgi:hypothetical protein